MADYTQFDDLTKAKLLLPIRYLQFPDIFENHAFERGQRLLFQLLPTPSDFYASSIKGLGAKKVALIERSLDALTLDTDEDLILPKGFNPDEECRRLESVQNKFLKDSFQPKLFPETATIKDLQSELQANLAMLVNFPGALSADVEREILLALWGWGDQSPFTLEEVGEMALSGKSVSRQRIQQMDYKARIRLKSSFIPYTHYLKSAIATLENLAPIHVTDVALALVEDGVTISPLKIDGLLSAAEILLGGASLHPERSVRIIFSNADTKWFHDTLKSIGSMVESNGACHLKRLSGNDGLSDHQIDLVKNFIEHSPEYFWLDAGKTWVFTKRKRNRVENNLQKIFSVTESVPIEICVGQVNKDHRLNEKLTTGILESLIQYFDFVYVEDGHIRREFSPNFPFAQVERAFLTQMTTEPDEFDIQKIETYAAKMVPRVTSADQVLSRSPIVRKVANRGWVLIGDKWIDTSSNATHTEDDDPPSREAAIDDCLKRMWRNAYAAAGQSGKTLQSTRKGKTIGFTEEEFGSYCRCLMRVQSYKCKLTQLPLELFQPNNDFMPSADRIDSDTGYVRGNIQIVCSFANRWKSNQENDQFRSLLAAVRRVEN